MSEPIYLRTWGELACFTRPEMKVERVSYPVITPSAARGLLEAILYKPQFRCASPDRTSVAASSQPILNPRVRVRLRSTHLSTQTLILV